MVNEHGLDIVSLKKDAKKAIWVFAIINIFVLVFYVVDGPFNEFVFVLLFIQAGIFLVWLLPVFIYQVIFKKLSIELSVYKALASYKDLMGHVSW